MAQDFESWKPDYDEFEQMTRKFYAGEVKVPEYKGFSGGFGSYAQRGGKSSMLRLRLTGGRVGKRQMQFLAKSIRNYRIDKLHFTTCQTIQLHNLDADAVCELAVQALDYGILTRGGGGDFPRNVMVSPLSGVEKGEYFDVYPYAQKVSEYLTGLIKTVHLPRKLKVGFSNSPANVPHATFRDLGFAARSDGKFDVYSAGGLGNNPKMGVRVAEAVDGSALLYHVKAMVKLFTTYGDYENRARARTRYMQDVLGENYAAEYQKMLKEAMEEENMAISVEKAAVKKKGDGTAISDRRVIAQKQDGLYAVVYHPVGGCPEPERMAALIEAAMEMDEVEFRISPEEFIYIVNCTAGEAGKLLPLTDDGAVSLFETSVACIGASICQVGVRDSQKLLRTLVDASREWGFADGVLPKIHISGCPSSCGTHQIGTIGFRGGMKRRGGKPASAFVLCAGGSDRQGEETFGEEIGAVFEEEIPAFLKTLGETVQASGMLFKQWFPENRDKFLEIAAPFVADEV